MAIIDKITGRPWTGPKPDDWLGADKGTYAEYSAMLDAHGAVFQEREASRRRELKKENLIIKKIPEFKENYKLDYQKYQQLIYDLGTLTVLNTNKKL